MSLIDLLEGCKDVALATREDLAAKAAQDVAEFEEFGSDLVSAPPAARAARRAAGGIGKSRAARCTAGGCV